MEFGVFSAGAFHFSIFDALVGGRYDNGSNAGLWYWNVNNASSNYSANIGARPLIFIKYLHIIFLAPWQKLVVLGGFSRFIFLTKFLERPAGKYKNIERTRNEKNWKHLR